MKVNRTGVIYGKRAIYGHDLQGWHKPTEDMRRVELKYYCIFVRGVLMIPMILGAMVFYCHQYMPWTGERDAEGSSGTLFVHGALTESACRLEMASAHQDVLLGEIGTGRLQKIGSRGEPVWIELHLEDCLQSGHWSR